ncbi:MAG: JAB domain-containing protein [Chitinophagaceae bacterium]|nr:DNA repair protein RadC [Bacteroidota bacterium]TAJ53961.1 MAG: JAB domain-containing protein [Chitinophagaceae bacterium]
MRKFSIKNWASDDQPRKKLLQSGATALSNAELLAILINNGSGGDTAVDVARNLLLSAENDLQKLAGLSVKEMMNRKIKGLGEAKAISITAALELGVRRNASGRLKTRVTRSEDIADFLRATLEHRQKEVFAVVFLNRNNTITHLEIISEGGLTGTVADPRVILKKALEHNATGIILCHNHPSGNRRPSKADEAITQKIKQAASLLDMMVMDHIIVSNEGYFSFADEGML